MTALVPVLARPTEPAKLLPALFSVIAPAPALILTEPVPVLIAPVCEMPVPAVSDSPPVAPAVMFTPDSASAPRVNTAMSFAPVLVRVTGPINMFAPTNAIAPAPALIAAPPVPVTIPALLCVMLPLAVMRRDAVLGIHVHVPLGR